jgi:serine/threonine protein kinase
LFRTYSNVYVAERRNLKGEYAIKTLKKKFKPEELRKHSIINEIAIMKKCRHTHVINFIEAYYSLEVHGIRLL